MCVNDKNDRPKPSVQKALLTLLAIVLIFGVFSSHANAEGIDSEPQCVLRVGVE